MGNIRTNIVAAAVLFMSIAASVVPANAAYSNASLDGGYSFLLNLWTANASSNEFAMAGVMTFDGAGSVTASYTLVVSGTVETGTISGTYTVTSNGTGTINFATGIKPNFSIVLNSPSDGVARDVQLLQINDANNEVVGGTAELQAPTGTYGLATLKGAFAFQVETWTTDSALAQNAAVGTFVFDGKGGVKAKLTFMYDGALETNSTHGTYTVNTNGSGTISLATGVDYALALNTVKKRKAGGLQLLNTANSEKGNLVNTGFALKQ